VNVDPLAENEYVGVVVAVAGPGAEVITSGGGSTWLYVKFTTAEPVPLALVAEMTMVWGPSA
jgi:hypothetical protein